MMFFYQNLNERPRSRVGEHFRSAPTGLPIRGRASWSPGDDSGTKLGVEWNLFSSRCAAEIDIDPYGDGHEVLLHLGLFPVDLYLHASNPTLKKFAERLVRQPSDLGDSYSGRNLGIRVFEWSLWWSLWVDVGGWTRDRPRWRQGNFNTVDALFGSRKHSARLLERRDIEIRMPEGAYKGVCEMKEEAWKRPRWPFPKYIVRAHIEMTDPIPIPGKGENSWDCGQDATHDATFPARSVSEAVGKLTGDTLSMRERLAGRDWRPESAPTGSAA